MLKTVGYPSTRTGDQTIDNGNLVIGTAGKGIDFSATSQAAGMTSELLDDYETGTWTPQAISYDGTLTVNGATYTKIGNLVKMSASVAFDGTADGSIIQITNFPFTPASINNGDGAFVTSCTNGTLATADFAGAVTQLRFFNTSGATVTYTTLGAATLQFTAFYSV